MSVEKEISYRRKGRVAAAVVSALVLVLLFINTFSKLDPPPGQPGVLIAFGAEDYGMNDDSDPYAEENNLEEVEEVSEPEVSEPEPTPSEADVTRDVVTDDASDAPPVKKEEKPKTEPKKEVKKPKEEPKKPKEEPKKPKEGGLFKKNTGSKTGKDGGKGKGDNDKPGPTGDKDGTGDSPTGGPVPGPGGDVGGGLSGRGVTNRPKIMNNTNQFGTVVIKVCVSPDGKVVTSSYTQRGSTTSNSGLVNLATKAAKGYKFKANPNAPDKQCGVITFKFRPG